MRRLWTLPLVGLLFLSACNSPHLVAENASLRAELKQRDKLVRELEDVLEKGENKLADIAGQVQTAEAKLQHDRGEWAEKERQFTRKIAQLEDELEQATGKKRVPEKTEPGKPEESLEPKKGETKAPDRSGPEEKPSDGKSGEGKKGP